MKHSLVLWKFRIIWVVSGRNYSFRSKFRKFAQHYFCARSPVNERYVMCVTDRGTSITKREHFLVKACEIIIFDNCLEWADDHFVVFVWRKLIHFLTTIQWPWPLTFKLQICSPSYSTKLEVSTAFLFRENRRHGTDGLKDRRTDGRTDGVQRLMRPPRGRVAHNNVGDECLLISGVERLECVDLRRHHHHCVVRTGRRLPGRSDRGLRGRAGCRVDHGLPALANSTHRQRCAAASYRHRIG